ncbi:hypothetical protein, partial [Cognatishimia sp. F0-27]|uniref:hypothetical protein n=1 Tax=Cognatishimia sp. F0-27 TaxID=2816855 RepID=UPI001DEB7F48|nr:hypothetical protein [Cognatishimia sp. F0-27]
VTMLSDQQIDSLIAVLNSGRSESEKRAYAQSFFEDSDPVANLGTGVEIDPDARMITDRDRTLIEAYAPDADLTELSEDQIDSLVAVLNSGRSEGDKRDYAQSIFQ